MKVRSIPIPVLRRKKPSSPTLRKRRLPRLRREPAKNLCDHLSEYLPDSAIENVYRAYLFAAQAHEGQRRRSGEAYIHHPLAVAEILAKLRLDERSIIAAILHDVIEDTPTAHIHLVNDFGEDVATLVDGVSKISQIEFDSKEHAEAENFRKMLLAMSRDIRVILIKLADRLHNMRTLGAMPEYKQAQISRQTMDIYAPIAARLGLYQWCRELEDLSFRFLKPEIYSGLVRAVEKLQGNRKSVIKKLRVSIEKAMVQSGIESRVVGRKKNIYSIYRKMKRKDKRFEDLHDVYGFRIIVDTPEQCYLALGVIHKLYKPIHGHFNDFIAISKTNGYQSLHTNVFGPFNESVEVQIRTESMHRIAEAGIAAHWAYKSQHGGELNQQEMARQWLLDLLDTQHQTGNPKEFLEHLKMDLFPDEVYVFTPNGDIKKLPRGATALDFAYAVHSDVGNRCAGARINHKLASLPTVLGNGDHVEILTSKESRPNGAWLNYAVTSRARASIRAFLKSQHRYDAVKLGKHLLNRAIRTRRFSRKKLSDEQKLDLISVLNVDSWDELLAEVGSGQRIPAMVAKQLLPSDPKGGWSGHNDEPLEIQGAEGMLITYPGCCCPIPGDIIIGLLTSGRGIVVHQTDCKNLDEQDNQPDKWLPVEWGNEIKGKFVVGLRLDVENKPGVLARLTTIVAEHNSNINNVNVEERDAQYPAISFVIEVLNRQHLAKIIRDIRTDDSVLRISRSGI